MIPQQLSLTNTTLEQRRIGVFIDENRYKKNSSKSFLYVLVPTEDDLS